MASDIIEHWKRQHSTRFVYRSYHLPTPDPSPSNADSLNSNFLQLGRRSGSRPLRAVHSHAITCQHCDTNTTLVGLKPATFRSLVRRATSSATELTLVLY